MFFDRNFCLDASYHHGLAHQQNSLDDLDNDTIPFDNVPVRYDGNAAASAGK